MKKLYRSEPFISFLTISANLEELLITRNSILSIIKSFDLKECNLIFVIKNSVHKKNFNTINKIIQSSNSFVCFDNGKGIYNAFNIGISKALELNSSHICFINGGDKLEKDFIKSVEICRNKPFAIIGGKQKVVFKESTKKDYLYQGGRPKWSINHPGSIYPTIIFSENKYLTYLKISADWHLNYSLRKKYEFIRHKYIVASFDFSNGISQSKDVYKLLLLDEIKVIQNYFKNPGYFLSRIYFCRISIIFIKFIYSFFTNNIYANLKSRFYINFKNNIKRSK